jgi:hypothetical protein
MSVTYLAATWGCDHLGETDAGRQPEHAKSRYVELAATHFVPLQFPNRVSAELGDLVDRCAL